MLQTQTIKPGTLGLLTRLMAVPELGEFNLAGGTSLALQIGHRESYDLDFFGNRPFTYQEINDLVSTSGEVKIIHQTKNILILSVDGVKVDFVNYRYPLLETPLIIDGLRLLKQKDIGAMKLAAITNCGKKRDFFDLFFLLRQFSMAELISSYREKFNDGNEWLVGKSITWFEDAEKDEDVKVFEPVPWAEVKKTIKKEALSYFR